MTVKELLVRGRKVFIAWTVLGVVGQVVAMVYFKPWGPGLGVANAPTRWIYMVIFDSWVMKLPTVLLAMSIIAGNEKWLAPRGRYQGGEEYPVFTTYVYASIAFMAALFAASGILSYQFFDLPAAPAAISVSFFSPIVGFFTLWLGGVLRALVFGTGNPALWALGIGMGDGATWIWLGIFYWWFREKTKYGKNIGALVGYWVVVYWVWRTIYMFSSYVWRNPVPALWARMGWFFLQFLPSGTFASVAGILAAEAVIRAVEGSRAKASRSAWR